MGLFSLECRKAILREKKKRRPRYILPQYLANLTQPYFGSICSCTNDILYAMFEDLRTFLRVFMSVKFYVRYE